MAELITTLGPKRADELGLILPHEHVFVDLRTWDRPGYAQADTDIKALLAPDRARLNDLINQRYPSASAAARPARTSAASP